MPSIEEVVQAAMEDREPESDMPEMPQVRRPCNPPAPCSATLLQSMVVPW